MSKHTPGPWFVVNVGDDDEPMYSVKAARIAGKEPRHEVALCATGDSPQEMETANARLIAAAPEMLEVLKAWVALADEAVQTYGEDMVHPKEREVIRSARAVIAKAGGRS